jgi:thiaminase/transcriptional activator TenA
MTTFTTHLRTVADPIWQAQHDHPLVRGLGDGTLDPEIFAFWLRQDYLFLIDFARLFATAVLRAPDLAAMTRFAGLLHETLTREMDLHRSYVKEFEGSANDLMVESKAPTTQGYTDFLLRTATTGDYPELLGALLPCMWGYSEIGIRLATHGLHPGNRYERWIETYADAGFAELAGWCRELTDATCADLQTTMLERVEQAFMTASRYELAFWEMAWRYEAWLV